MILIVAEAEHPSIIEPGCLTLPAKDINAWVISSYGAAMAWGWHICIERQFTFTALLSPLEKHIQLILGDIVLVDCITGWRSFLVEPKSNNYLLLISTIHRHCSKWLQRWQLYSLRLQHRPLPTFRLESVDLIGSIVIGEQSSNQKDAIFTSNQGVFGPTARRLPLGEYFTPIEGRFGLIQWNTVKVM